MVSNHVAEVVNNGGRKLPKVPRRIASVFIKLHAIWQSYLSVYDSACWK